MVELQFQAVPFQAVVAHQPAGVVPLDPDAYPGEALPVDHQVTGAVFLPVGAGQEALPVLVENFQRVHPPCIK